MYWLVVSTPLLHTCSIYGKIINVPNHQPVYIYNFKYPYLTCTMLYPPPAWQVRAAPAPVKAVAWAGSPPRRGEGGSGKYNRGKTWENTWKSCEKLKKLWESWEKLGKSWESRWKFHRKREHIES